MTELENIYVTKVSKNRYCISLKWAGKRYRFYNGTPIGIKLFPNKMWIGGRKSAFNELSKSYLKAVSNGWSPEQPWHQVETSKPSGSILELALESKLQNRYSYHYRKKLIWLVGSLESYLQESVITAELASAYLNNPKWSNAMRNNLRRHFISLENDLRKFGYQGSIKTLVRNVRVAERLHKPIKNLSGVLEEIEGFNLKLFLCCLLSYECLLRPHREIRSLTWGDFNEDLTVIALSGSQTKGRRNRIVPVGNKSRAVLLDLRPKDWAHEVNIFSNTNEPYSIGYFNNLWTRFKKQSCLVENDQTLYSFRHTGSIQLFKKTESLQKLQQALGHSSLAVSLTYLRGLSVLQLKVEDMPSLD